MSDSETIVINADRYLRPPGRPPRIDMPEDLLDAACDYFETCEQEGQRPTITGLALSLGYSGREGLIEAGEARDGVLHDAIKKVKSVVAMWREAQLGSGKDVGHIFVLKNMGWKDEQQREVNANVNTKFERLSPREAAQALLEMQDEQD